MYVCVCKHTATDRQVAASTRPASRRLPLRLPPRHLCMPSPPRAPPGCAVCGARPCGAVSCETDIITRCPWPTRPSTCASTLPASRRCHRPPPVDPHVPRVASAVPGGAVGVLWPGLGRGRPMWIWGGGGNTAQGGYPSTMLFSQKET